MARIHDSFERCVMSFKFLTLSLKEDDCLAVRLRLVSLDEVKEQYTRIRIWGDDTGAVKSDGLELEAKLEKVVLEILSNIADILDKVFQLVYERYSSTVQPTLAGGELEVELHDSDFEDEDDESGSDVHTVSKKHQHGGANAIPSRSPKLALLLDCTRSQLQSLFDLAPLLQTSERPGQQPAYLQRQPVGLAAIITLCIERWRAMQVSVALPPEGTATIEAKLHVSSQPGRQNDGEEWLYERLDQAYSRRGRQIGDRAINLASAVGGHRLFDDPKIVYGTDSHAPGYRRPHNPRDSTVCPYCGEDLEWEEYDDNEAWREHALRDLGTYICTFEICPDAARVYTTREEWQDHEMQYHRRQFVCRAHGCNTVVETRHHMEEHLRTRHRKPTTTDLELNMMLELCDRPARMTVSVPESCILCTALVHRPLLLSHLADHMDELSLLVLPKFKNSALGLPDAGETDSNEALVQGIKKR